MYVTSDAQAIAHHALTDAQVAPWAMEEHEMNSHPLQSFFHIISYGMEYPFGQFKSAVLILFPPSSLGLSLQMSWALHNTALHATINIGVISTLFFSKNKKHSIIADTLKKKPIPSQLKLRQLFITQDCAHSYLFQLSAPQVCSSSDLWSVLKWPARGPPYTNMLTE